MKARDLPQIQLVSIYLDALAQLATGFKRELTNESLARLAHGPGKADLFTAWSQMYPNQAWSYEPLSQTDVSRLTSLLNSVSKLLTKFMPDLKAIDIHDSTERRLAPEEQAARIADVFAKAGIPSEQLSRFTDHLIGAPARLQ